jgi:hypothetical protein
MRILALADTHGRLHKNMMAKAKNIYGFIVLKEVANG